MGAELAELIRPGARVALGEGVGTPVAILAELSDAARAAGDVSLLLGWTPVSLSGLDLSAFREVRTLMGGYALRADVEAGRVHYVPCRLGAVAPLLHGPLRPDVLVAAVSDGPPTLITEVGWMRAAVDTGAVVAAVVQPGTRGIDRGGPLPEHRVVPIGCDATGPGGVEWPTAGELARAVAERVVALIEEGVRVQYGPGAVGGAVLDALTVQVAVDTGLVTDAVLRLAHRGLLRGRPLTPYLAGSPDLYAWAEDHVDLDRLEVTHDAARLSTGTPLVAINTALEVDLDGQVNVEGIGGAAVAGVGGQPDYASGAARSKHGLSIVAVPSRRGPHTTLVERLSAPASTPSHDIEVLVTEHGTADLRGLDRRERRRAIERLWR